MRIIYKKKKIISTPVQIHGIDIDKDVIDKAILGIYKKDSLDKISLNAIQRNFNQKSEGLVQIKERIKKYCTFSVQDILKPYKSPKYDLISCRNFLIYVSREQQKQVIQNLINNLRYDGYFLLGKTEGFPIMKENSNFVPENIKEHIYQIKKS